MKISIFTEEMIDKMYGGIYSAYYEKLDEFVASMKEGEQHEIADL